ncbi:2,3-bisphosphoglycerate-dependent phosphoglycerate mutase [Sodalis praecaptivus]|nr:2,3-bisphosphoglycerate-dependent phosphoglycerate mutase [Sodalis praecaptivus]
MIMTPATTATAEKRLVIVRHGESLWNRENRFTGWTDVKLTERGRIEAIEAARLLKQHGYRFDFACTSLLVRAVHSLWLLLDELGQSWLPEEKSWRLNERHYGALEGLNKAVTAERYGHEQVMAWRRGYRAAPPPLLPDDPRHPGRDARYRRLAVASQPLSESLAATEQRVIDYWREVIVPRLRRGEHVLLVSHSNVIRALVKHLDGLEEDALTALYIPTCVPIVYEFDDKIAPRQRYFLGDEQDIANRIAAVIRTGSKK